MNEVNLFHSAKGIFQQIEKTPCEDRILWLICASEDLYKHTVLRDKGGEKCPLLFSIGRKQ